MKPTKLILVAFLSISLGSNAQDTTIEEAVEVLSNSILESHLIATSSDQNFSTGGTSYSTIILCADFRFAQKHESGNLEDGTMEVPPSDEVITGNWKVGFTNNQLYLILDHETGTTTYKLGFLDSGKVMLDQRVYTIASHECN